MQDADNVIPVPGVSGQPARSPRLEGPPAGPDAGSAPSAADLIARVLSGDVSAMELLAAMRSAIERASSDLERVTGAASSVVGGAQGIVGQVGAHAASLAQSAAESA